MLNYLFSLVIIISLAIRVLAYNINFPFFLLQRSLSSTSFGYYPPSPIRVSYFIAHNFDIYIMPRSENLCDKLTYWGFSLPGSYVLVLKYSSKSIKRFKCYGPMQRPYYKKANKGTKVLHAAQKEN
jgi:hypothetical protein